MSTPSKRDITHIKINRARSALKEAQLLFENNYHAASLNRLYYACFYAATALLYSKDIFVKTHSGVKQMLSLHFVVPGLINDDYGKIYSDLFRNRTSVDYDDIIFADVQLVKKYLGFANDFVLLAQNILEIK